MYAIVSLLLVSLISHACATGPLCHMCDDVLTPSDCQKVMTCQDHEQCFVQKLRTPTQREYFKLGCISRNTCLQNQTTHVQPVGRRDENGGSDSANMTAHDVTSLVRRARANPGDSDLCLECANDANDQLGKCGSSPHNDLRCLACSFVSNPHDCDGVVQCGDDEQCFIAVQPTSVLNGKLLYSMSCQRNIMCKVLSSAAHSLGCFECCATSYCNQVCNGHALKTTTKATIVATTTLPGNHRPVVTIVGPASADYNTSVTLTCQTDVHVESYMWTLDGHQLTTARSSTLTIPALISNSTGTYRCTAITNGQSGYADHQVRIKSKAAHVISFTKQKDPQSGVVLFTCVYEGYPLPIVDWSFAGVSGTQLANNFHLNDARSFGIISQYYSEVHDGNYTCGAKNFFGGDSKTVTLP